MDKRIACRVQTPVGRLTALYQEGAIVRVLFPDEPISAAYTAFNDTLPFAVQINEYFEGKRRCFELPLKLSGTPFMRAVYNAALWIPYGHTATYAELALLAGYPRAMRAAGTALRRITLPILIPCHRVVHKDFTKSAYRGGTDIKSYLLDMEARFCGAKDGS